MKPDKPPYRKVIADLGDCEEDSLLRSSSASDTRARARRDALYAEIVETPPSKLRCLLEAITVEDRELVLVRLREALNAERRSWNMTTKQWDYEPDGRLRFEAVKLALSYLEGLPVARQVNLNIGHEDLQDVLDRAKQSPAMQSALRMLGVHKTGTAKVIDVPSQESNAINVQETNDK